MVHALISEGKKLSLSRLVSLYFPFQGTEYGILWTENKFLLLFTFTRKSNSNQAYKKTLHFHGAKKLGLDLYRIQIARSSELLRYISRLNCCITSAQGIPSQIRDDVQIICLP